ncbi:MAG: Methyltransferase type 11 [Candidatus Levybacteria bacterium GW2011_GWA1_39_11]|nr:MAG: Methyltransferase type 11 [Candidatus Levybacteria bacterium GW2011_GWA1_39_11]
MKRVIEQYNDRLAKVYDEATGGEFKWKAAKESTKILLPKLGKQSKILDLGIGTGQSIQEFYRSGHIIIGVDISGEMLKIVRKKFPKITLYKFDIDDGLQKLGLEPNSFEAVMGVGIFEFIKDLKKLSGQIARVTKRTGFLCFAFEEYIKDHPIQGNRVTPLGQGLVDKIPRLMSFKVYRRTVGEVKSLFENLGFEILATKKFVGYLKSKKKIPVHYGLILAREKF